MFFVVRRSTWLCRVDVDGLTDCARPTAPHHYQGAWTTRRHWQALQWSRFAFLDNDVRFRFKNNIQGGSKIKLLILSEYVNKIDKTGGTWANTNSYMHTETRSYAIAEGPRHASRQLKSCQLPRNSAETTCTTSPEQIEVMKNEGYSGAMCNKHMYSTMTWSSHIVL